MENNFGKLILRSLLVGVFFVLGTSIYFKKIQPRQTGILKPEEAVQILKPEEAVQKAINFINENLLREEMKATVVTGSVVEASGLYKFKLKIGEEEHASFVTKDGKILFPMEGINLEQKISQPPPPPAPKEIEKREKPDVKVFVMTHCPYGVQIQKAILPVWQLLDKKADFGVYFVDYLMRGKEELEENLRQYCIQKEEKEKYLAYLSCFTLTGKVLDCQKQAKLNEEKLKSCLEKTDKEFKISEQFENFEGRYPPFPVHTTLNDKYGVQGSPTLIINDTEASVLRSPEAIKETICKSFLNPPPECNQKLSEQVASAGFGEGTTSGGGGSCQ